MRVVLFILTAVWMSLIVHVEGECDQPPVVIDSLPAFECSLLSNDFNIQNLTKVFFPTNQHPALVVEVYYYVNQTVHPDDPSHLKNSSNSTADYVYRWYASAILGFIQPKILTALSIGTLTVEMSNAHIVLAPLICDDEDWIRDLLSTGTTWVGINLW